MPRLPLEIIEHIIGVIDAIYRFPYRGHSRTLLSCGLTCRALKNSSLSHLYDYIDIQSGEVLQALLLCTKQYPSVASRLKATRTVVIDGGGPDDRWMDSIPLHLASWCPNITSLLLRDIDFTHFCTNPMVLPNPFARLQKLTHLNLGSHRFRNVAQIQRMISAFPTLDILDVWLHSTPGTITGSLQDVYLSPALTKVSLQGDITVERLDLLKWILGSPSVRELSLNLFDAELVMGCLAGAARNAEILQVSCKGWDEQAISLSVCEKLHTLVIYENSQPHTLLSTLPAHSEIRVLELGFMHCARAAWGRLAHALREPQFAKLQHVVVRIFPTPQTLDCNAFENGDGETTLGSLCGELRRKDLVVTTEASQVP